MTEGEDFPKLSQFDDTYTLRRKWAFSLGTHFDTLIQLEDTFVNLEDEENGYYARYYNDDMAFSELAQGILSEYKYIFVLDIIMSFVKYVGEDNINDWDYIFEEFYKVDNNRKYESKEEFLKYYRIWNNERDNTLEANGEYVEIIDRTHEDLADLESRTLEGNYYITSVFKHNNVSFVINPKLKDGSKIVYKDGIDIFDAIVVSESVPFVKYNDEVKSHYKVFRGNSINSIPNYSNIDIPEEQSNDINIIYMKLWSRNDIEMEKTAKKDYIKVIYYLKFNKIHFTLPEIYKNISEEEAFTILSETFTNLDLSERERVDVKGTFDIFSYEETEEGAKIYPLTFDEFSILDIMTRFIDGWSEDIEKGDYEYLLGSYFFLDEVENIFSTKVAMKLHYRSLTSGKDLGNKLRKDFRLPSISKANIELVNNVTTMTEDYSITEFDQDVTIQRATEYIQVNVNAKDEFELDLIIRILKISLYAYNLSRNEITNDYLDILGKKTVNSLRLYQKEYKNVNLAEYEDSNSRKLKKLDKDIFVSSYPTICRNIPLAISDEEINEWKEKKVREVKNDGRVIERERQVISFPKNDPKYNLVCEDPASYIGMIRNTLSNRAEYSHLPCCYLVDQQVRGEATGFNEYYREIKTGPKGGKSKGLVKGKFILLPERYGNIPVQLNEMLNLYSETPTKFYRYGVASSINSLIHCVCKALQIDMYLDKEKDPDELEDYVTKIRGVLTKMPNVYKQELYDFTDTELTEVLSNGNIFLDPALFYRGLEELFGVNIFTFVPTVDSAAIEVPRKWLFHVSNSKPDRTNILIYKHYGSNRDTRDFPQCELIVEDVNGGLIGTFNKDMYRICTAILGGMTSTVIWTPKIGNNEEEDSIEGNSDIYSSVDYNTIVERSAYEQYIDKYGKCRALNFRVSDDDTEYNITMITPPTQPLDLPLMKDKLNHADHNLVITLFGNFSRVDLNENNKAVGLWFKIYDVEEGIYVPIEEVDISELKEGVVKGSSNPILQNEKSKADRYSSLKRTLNIFLELLKWIYEIYKVEKNIPDGDVENFVEEYFRIDPNSDDSLNYYNFSSVPYRLPKVSNVDEALDFLVQTGMTEDRTIMMYNETFSEQAYEYIKRYNKYTEGLEGNPSTFIAGYFQNVNDYKLDTYTLLFTSSKSYREWLERMVYGPFRMFDISNEKLSEKAVLSMPYIIYENGKYIMIQNVMSGDLERAVAVALKWNKEKINSGYNSLPMDEEEIKNNIAITLYTISVQNSLMILDKPKRKKGRVLVDILRYGSSVRGDKLAESVFTRYAAILPLN